MGIALEAPMRRFSTVDLDKNIGDVKALAAREPVVITEYRKDRFVMMSIEDFNRLRRGGDPQRVYGVAETPTDIADRFISEIDRVLDEPLG
jgi:PHD/YefM family antitoxin component YafN of YafNO toxin-antitoxin module